ncbi:MAG: HD family phosphohydrolase [Anaerolineae bacterium]
MRRISWSILMGALLWLSWAIATVDPSQSISGLEVGSASPRAIKAAHQVSYVSDVATRLARDEAALRVADVYSRPDPGIATEQLRQLQLLQERVSQARQARDLTLEQRLELLAEIPDIDLSDDAWPAMLQITDTRWRALQQESERVLAVSLASEVRSSDLSRARLDVQRLMAYTLSPADRDIVSAQVTKLIVPNTFLDTEATERQRMTVRDAVQPVIRTILQGESIVREGEIITEGTYEKLQVLGLIEQQPTWHKRAADLGISLILALSMVAYAGRVYPMLIDRPRQQLLLVLALLLVTAAARVIVPGRLLVPFIYPAAAAAMLVTLFLNIRFGTFIAVAASISVASIAGGSLELAIYTLIGSVVGSLWLMRGEHLNSFVRAAAALAVSNIAVLLLSGVQTDHYDTLGLLQLAGAGATNAVLSSIICFVAYAFAGRLFGITTSLQLMELARPTNPLFRQLLIKAPGTYHHSILISNMAERAAEAIGADALLSRVGAYYHDIGKIARPWFFTENQSDGQNPHDHLDPQTSAEIIIGHIAEGVALARRYRLPEKVIAFIPEHHGTTLAAYFYRRAAQEYQGPDELDASTFRYSGPRPQSKETAIVMLADAVEAWSRANRPTTHAEVERVIRQVISERLISGELDETNLTFQDLDRIRQAFASILTGVYHPRVQYPDQVSNRRRRDSASANS